MSGTSAPGGPGGDQDAVRAGLDGVVHEVTGVGWADAMRWSPVQARHGDSRPAGLPLPRPVRRGGQLLVEAAAVEWGWARAAGAAAAATAAATAARLRAGGR